ncbi:hypothetical protein BO82DRAFT_384295 [Aspergillus uvarum CBS 121591]|uniref:SH3 domain-containing protein n=1 Tax=Aspergillus uvarum CBS 121591 TaxID=1448315 RepID=A0A319C5W0_9EURO|nr:hypothetical protein BO82DRAFT_384295 [Aspergillus uvarum CBS 121591]PYH80645.1 hypothetical protein BO82DRAFT_384295 [Aspergillus uvarum CBS 121591]
MRLRNRPHGLGLAKRQPQLADASGSTWSAGGASTEGTSQWAAGTSVAGSGQWAGTWAATAPVAAADGTTAAGASAADGSAAGTAQGSTEQWTAAAATDTTTQSTAGTTAEGAGTEAAAAAAAPAAPAAAQDSTAAGTASTWAAPASDAASTGETAAGIATTDPTTQWSAGAPSAEPPTAAAAAPVVGATTFATAVIPTATGMSKSLPSSNPSEATATSTVISVDSGKHAGTPGGTKAAIGLSVVIVVAAMAGLILWSLRRKKRRLRQIIAKSRGEKVSDSPRTSDEFVRYASKVYTEGTSAVRQAGGKIKTTYQSKIPVLRRHFENAKYEPIKEFSRKVYSTSVTTLKKVGGFVHSSWGSKTHVPRPYSTYSTYSSSSLHQGLRDLPRSCHANELAPVMEVSESIESPTGSSETLVGDVGRLKDAAVSSTPKLETGKFPEAKVATVETVTPISPESSGSSSPSSLSSTASSSPSVSRSPTVDRVSRSPTVESRTYPGTPDISFARVYRVEMDFKPVSPEHVELKEGQNAVLHLVYDDGWALVNVLETAQEGLVPRACFGAYPVRHQAQYMGSNLQISTDGIPRSISSATPTEYGSDGDIGRFYSQCASPDLPTPASLHETLPRPQRLKSLPSLASLFRSASSFKSMV